MAFFTSQELSDVTSDPNNITTIYQNRKAQLQAQMSAFSGINSNGWKVIFAGLMAHEIKPYGASTALTLEDILAEPAIDCDNYIALTHHFVELLIPTSAFGFAFVGWNNGAVGNHAQGFATGTGINLVIDPTVGLFALAGFNQVARTSPVSALKDYFVGRTSIQSYHDTVKTALTQGTYLPQDLMYYFRRFDDYVEGRTHQTYWATPQAPQ